MGASRRAVRDGDGGSSTHGGSCDKGAADIDHVLGRCFARPAEANLVKQLAIDGELVLVLIARDEATSDVQGLVAVSRMTLSIGGDPAPAVALAPVAVRSAAADWAAAGWAAAGSAAAARAAAGSAAAAGCSGTSGRASAPPIRT